MHGYGALVEWYWQEKSEVLGEKPVAVSLCPPQISHGLNWDRTHASALRCRRLTAQDMTGPLKLKGIKKQISFS